MRLAVCLLCVGLSVLPAAAQEDPFAPTPGVGEAKKADPLAPTTPASGKARLAQAPEKPVPLGPESFPILRVSSHGPLARCSAVLFGPDGKTLYAAGGDKVVHAWRLGRTPDDEYQERPPHFIPSPEQTLRVPVGPGLWGTINVMAQSGDGRWLAVGGWGWAEQGRGVADFRETGLIWPNTAFFPETLEDIGTIYLFDLTTGDVKRLRGHQGPVIGLAFADGKTPGLVSIGIEKPPGADVKASVRAWNVAEAREVGRTMLPKDPGERYSPSLTAWQLPDGTVRAAFTWLDGWVRIWDVGQDRPQGYDVGLSLVCVRRPGTNEVLFGEFYGGQNNLSQRLFPADRGGWDRIRNPISFGATRAPVAAAFLPTEGAKPPEYVALAVAEAKPTGPTYFLEVRRVADGRLVGVRLELPFTATPTLSASSAGYLAAASADDGTVLLYETARLLAGETRPVPVERLVGIGLPVARAEWVRRDGHRGLRLHGGDEAGRHVLDLSAGEITTAEGWQDDTGTASGWTVRAEPQGRETRLSITAADGQRATAIVPERASVHALCPIVPGIDRPILAAAATGTDDAGWLYLFDARSGEKLRKLTGHTGPVVSLAFSADGRLLVSTAADRTLNVWWLDDLEQLVGTRALLRGLSVASGDGGLVVKEFLPEATAELRRELPVGRVIQGVVRSDGKLLTFASPGEFYRYVSEQTPGARLTLRTDRNDVAVTVGQGIDERKPLFSLFIERDRATESLSWIGWSPLGPFESSDRLIERLVGWHFNPPRAGEPVRFADLGEYRESFFGRGLLDQLIRTGRVPEQWPPVQPKVSALFRDAKQAPQVPDAAGRVELPEAPSELIVEVTGLPADRVSSVRWQMPGRDGPLTPSPQARGVWTADLADLGLEPGEHPIDVEVAGSGFSPITTRLVLSMQREAAVAPQPRMLPRVALLSPRAGASIYEREEAPGTASTEVRVHVGAWNGPGSLAVEFLINGEPVQVDNAPLRIAVEPSEKPTVLSSSVPLVPGSNRLSVRLRGEGEAIGPEQSAAVRFLRPPVVESIDGPKEVDGETGSLRAIVRSPLPLVPESIRLRIGGVPVTTNDALIEAADDAGKWNVAIDGIPLSGSRNEIELELANADGQSRQPGRLQIARVSPAPKPVFIEFANLPTESVVASAEIPVTVTVRTPAMLRQVAFSINGETVQLPLPEASDDGSYRFQQVATLDRSVSTLRVVATASDGGIGQAEATVTVVKRPVTIEIDRIVAANGSEFAPRSNARGSVGIEGAIPTETATLHGRIVWTAESDLPASSEFYLYSWVNGFLQSSHLIDAADRGLEQPFEIEVALSRKTGNHIRLELPALAEENAGRGELLLDCAAPSSKQRVHLLVAGVGLPESERENFTRDVVESLRAGGQDVDEEQLVVYPPLVGDVYSGDILVRLQLFRHRPSEPGSWHDVLLVYFHGQEAPKDGGHFVLVTNDLSANPGEDESAVTSERLSALLEETRGAHLLFLDVAPLDKAGTRPPAWPRDSHLGVLRSVWLGDGAAPAEYSLWSSLRQASRLDGRLGRIADAIKKMRGNEKQLVFDPHVPSDLWNLVLLGPNE